VLAVKIIKLVRPQILRLDKLGVAAQARELRRNMTFAEALLWERLRRNQLGIKFRRQQIIEGFVADFYGESARLVIEVDGGVHDTPEQKSIDERRRNVFKSRGLREIRFSNIQIETALEAVILWIKSLLSFKEGPAGGHLVWL
jgi:imidazole glycerol-phosphate synthase subunit HisF